MSSASDEGINGKLLNVAVAGNLASFMKVNIEEMRLVLNSHRGFSPVISVLHFVKPFQRLPLGRGMKRRNEKTTNLVCPLKVTVAAGTTQN